MSFVIIFLIVISLLFAMAFFTKRRFGALGLGLAAGSLLSTLWASDITPTIASAGFELVRPPLESVVAASITLLPAVLLVFVGPTYKKMLQRVAGALAFAVLAVALLLEPLGAALVIEGVGKQVHDIFTQNKDTIITAGILLAVLDLLLTKKSKIPLDHKGH